MATSDPSICAVGECAEHRGMVYGLVAPLWEQTAVLADRLTGRAEDKVYEGSRTSTKLKVMGVDLAVMGEKQGRDADDEVVTYAEPRRGVYHKLIVRDGKLAGAILLGDTSAAPALQQLFDRSTPLPDVARLAALPDGRGAGPALGRGPAGRRPDLQLQRRLEGRHRRRAARRLPHLQGGLRRDPGRHRLRLVQGPGQGDRRGGGRRRPAGRSVGALLRARRGDGQARS